jgi:hypothetical protein
VIDDEETTLMRQCTDLARMVFDEDAVAHLALANRNWLAGVIGDRGEMLLCEAGDDRVTALLALRLALFHEANRAILRWHQFARENTQRADELLAAANVIDVHWEAKGRDWSPQGRKF